MRGTHRISLQNKRIRYDFEIKRNITVIRGDSATGKTALVDMIREHYENGTASAVELTCDKECTVLEGRTWAGQLSMMKDSIVFIDEGNEFYHLYPTIDNRHAVRPEKVIAEDSNAGYQFLQDVCEKKWRNDLYQRTR